jgi:hypothetical protein
VARLTSSSHDRSVESWWGPGWAARRRRGKSNVTELEAERSTRRPGDSDAVFVLRTLRTKRSRARPGGTSPFRNILSPRTQTDHRIPESESSDSGSSRVRLGVRRTCDIREEPETESDFRSCPQMARARRAPPLRVFELRLRLFDWIMCRIRCSIFHFARIH